MVTKEKIDYFLLKPIDWLDENSSTWSDWLDYALRHEDNIIDIIDNNRKDLSQALSLINPYIVLYVGNDMIINEYELENTLVDVIKYITLLEQVKED